MFLIMRDLNMWILVIYPRGLNSCFCFSGGPAPGAWVHHHNHRLWPAQLLQQLRGRGEAVRGPGVAGGIQGPGSLHRARIPGPRPGRPDIQPLPGLPGPLSGPPLPRLGPGLRSGQMSQVTICCSLQLRGNGCLMLLMFAPSMCISLNGALCGLSGYDIVTITRPSPGQWNIWGILHFTLILSVNSTPGRPFPPQVKWQRGAQNSIPSRYYFTKNAAAIPTTAQLLCL